MKVWSHKDICLSVAKINAYRQREEYDIMRKWINELREKLNDLEHHFCVAKKGEHDE